MNINKCNDCSNESCPDYIPSEYIQKLFQKKVQIFIISLMLLLIIALN